MNEAVLSGECLALSPRQDWPTRCCHSEILPLNWRDFVLY